MTKKSKNSTQPYKKVTRNEVKRFIQLQMSEASSLRIMERKKDGRPSEEVLDIHLLLREIVLSNLPNHTITYMGNSLTITENGCVIYFNTNIDYGILTNLDMNFYMDWDENLQEYRLKVSPTPSGYADLGLAKREALEHIILIFYGINEAYKIWGEIIPFMGLDADLLDYEPAYPYGVRPTITSPWVSGGHYGHTSIWPSSGPTMTYS